MLPPIGIWKDLRLEGYSTARLGHVHVTQSHDHGAATVNVTAKIEALPGPRSDGLTLKARLTAPDGAIIEAEGPADPVDGEGVALNLFVTAPHIWWPNGYGVQPLYDLEVTLHGSSGAELDRGDHRIGLRTIELRQQPDQWGKSWQFVVNGIPFFAKDRTGSPPIPSPPASATPISKG